MDELTTAVVRQSHNTDVSRSVWYHGFLLIMHTTGEETNGQFSVVETVTRRDQGLAPPKHIHWKEEESFYILEGQATFHVGDEVVQAGPGAFVTLPRGVPHWFSIDSDEIRWLNIITPAGFEHFFRELGEPARAATLPPPSDAPLDVPELVATAKKYGCDILPPD